jgi:hypothetical protein
MVKANPADWLPLILSLTPQITTLIPDLLQF